MNYMEFWAQNLGAWFRSPYFNICMYDILFLFVLEQSLYILRFPCVHLIQALSIEVADANVQSLW